MLGPGILYEFSCFYLNTISRDIGCFGGDVTMLSLRLGSLLGASLIRPCFVSIGQKPLNSEQIYSVLHQFSYLTGKTERFYSVAFRHNQQLCPKMKTLLFASLVGFAAGK